MPKTHLITRDQIAERAFEIWEHEGKPDGRDQEHWERAEAELREHMARMAPAKPKRAAKPKVEAVKAKLAKLKAAKSAAKSGKPRIAKG